MTTATHERHLLLFWGPRKGLLYGGARVIFSVPESLLDDPFPEITHRRPSVSESSWITQQANNTFLRVFVPIFFFIISYYFFFFTLPGRYNNGIRDLFRTSRYGINNDDDNIRVHGFLGVRVRVSAHTVRRYRVIWIEIFQGLNFKISNGNKRKSFSRVFLRSFKRPWFFKPIGSSSGL